jgi:hypothetical protein
MQAFERLLKPVLGSSDEDKAIRTLAAFQNRLIAIKRPIMGDDIDTRQTFVTRIATFELGWDWNGDSQIVDNIYLYFHDATMNGQDYGYYLNFALGHMRLLSREHPANDVKVFLVD